MASLCGDPHCAQSAPPQSLPSQLCATEPPTLCWASRRVEDALFWLYVRGSHHFSPLLGIAYEQSFKFGGRALERGATELTKPRIEGRIGKAGINLLVKQFDDVRRRLSTRRDTEPNARLITRDEFADCGDIRRTPVTGSWLKRLRHAVSRTVYSRPELGIASNMTCARPANRSVRAGAAPWYGTWSKSTPAIILNNSPVIWGVVPLPTDAMIIVPGFAFA